MLETGLIFFQVVISKDIDNNKENETVYLLNSVA